MRDLRRFRLPFLRRLLERPVHIPCPDCCGGVSEKDGAPCVRCQGVGRFTPHSCTVCGNSLPCPECGDTSGEWRPGYRF